MERIYLDYASTTPVDAAVLKAMQPYFRDVFANPGSLHQFGQEASAAIFSARREIADLLQTDYGNIIFTGSATEANNLVIKGVLQKAHKIKNPKIIISAFEHESILVPAQEMEQWGAKVVRLPVSRSGLIDLKKLKSELDANTVLVSLMYVNNEVGTIQPLKQAAKILKEFRSEKQYPLFHSDASQAFQFLPCVPKELGLDLMTLSGHKIYGPKGAGLLYINDKENLSPLLSGGGQEDSLRSSTENTPAIVGLAKAMQIVSKDREKESKRLSALRNDLLKGLKKIFPKLQLNGSLEKRVASNLNCSIPGISSEQSLVFFDLQGIAIAAGPACSARSLEPAKALLAMGLSLDRASRSIRISLGKGTKKSEINRFLTVAKMLKKRLS